MSTLAIVLFGVYCAYLNFGGVIFMFLEYEKEEVTVVVETSQWTRLKEILQEWTSPSDEAELPTLLNWLNETCPNVTQEFSVTTHVPGNFSLPLANFSSMCPNLVQEASETQFTYPWNFMDSLYFSMTVATTIGYGHISPSTTEGRIGCMIYAVFGIPLTMMLLSLTSDFFGERLFILFKNRLDQEKQVSKVFIALGTVFYILMGFIGFIFLPAIVFTYTEKWTYLEGVYYAFISLTTIGFGDFVTAKSMDGVTLYLYQTAVIIWIVAGLGYWVMVANFIIRALRSKEMQTFAKKATDLKKLMNQMGITQSNPEFLMQNSKTSMNFMLQLGSSLAMGPPVPQSSSPQGQSPAHQPPLGVPGISTLFSNSGLNGMMSQMNSIAVQKKEDPVSPTPTSLPKTDSHEMQTIINTPSPNGKTFVQADVEENPSLRGDTSHSSGYSDQYGSNISSSNILPPTTTTEFSSMDSFEDCPPLPINEVVDSMNEEAVLACSDPETGGQDGVNPCSRKGKVPYAGTGDDSEVSFSIRL